MMGVGGGSIKRNRNIIIKINNKKRTEYQDGRQADTGRV